MVSGIAYRGPHRGARRPAGQRRRGSSQVCRVIGGGEAAAEVVRVGWRACGRRGHPARALPTVKVLFCLTLVSWYAAIAIAILKYRLYDIGRVISRTLAYAIVTGVLAAVYTELVLLATQVFRVYAPVAVAAATLAAVALFSPVRRRVQRRVDRRFNRARYDPDQTAAAFSARLKDAVDLDTVCGDLARVVQAALEPTHVSVWTSRHG